MPHCKPIAERFWSHVDRSGGEDACWLWTADTFRNGRGKFALTAHKKIGAHRLSYDLAYGEPPPDKPLVLHSCHNGACVNPQHLHAGTHADNMREMKEAGRAVYVHGELHPRVKLTARQVVEIRRNRAQRGTAICQLAVEHHLSDRTIYDIISRRTWAHIPDDETAKQS